MILDTDLAMLYGVETRRLNEQVRRNTERFPEDFMFQLTKDEALSSRSQFAILKSGRIMKKIIVMVVTMLPVVYWKVSTK